MSTYLTARTQRVVAERMAEDYLHHGASIRVLMFQEGLSYGAVHRLLTQVAGVRLRGRGGPANHTELRGEFDDLDDDRRDRLAAECADAFTRGGRITELARRHGLYPLTVVRLLEHAAVAPPRRLDRAPRRRRG